MIMPSVGTTTGMYDIVFPVFFCALTYDRRIIFPSFTQFSKVMARFAEDCRKKFHIVVLELEKFLGPDTADLETRTGVSST